MSIPKILFLCTGVGIFNRGIETFFRDAFDGLRGSVDVEIELAKGAGPKKPGEHVLWNLPRTGMLAKAVGACVRRNGYVVEQLSAFPEAIALIRRWRPQVIFYSDSNLGFQLHRWRRKIGVPFKLLFSNGGPCSPPFDRTDFVQQVAPPYLEEALAAGEPREKHFMIPYGIRVPAEPRVDPTAKAAVRAKLGLPLGRQIVLSVGWISRHHKRMDYVIEEVAKLPQPRPFLQLLGAMDAGSTEIVDLGHRLLGPAGFGVCSVGTDEVAAYYRAADVFVLASLAEGFGRVYIEALMH
ncbi:MAG TPA: glycosyltransferase, partial [Prosthecobacter sp.]|nr:glycosyltransferase [Prosthecobacter sp.]